MSKVAEMSRGRTPKTQPAMIINGKQNVVVDSSEGGFAAMKKSLIGSL